MYHLNCMRRTKRVGALKRAKIQGFRNIVYFSATGWEQISADDSNNSDSWTRGDRTMNAWFFQHLARPGFVIRHGPSPDISQLVPYFSRHCMEMSETSCFFELLLFPVSATRPPKRKKYANVKGPIRSNGGASSMLEPFQVVRSNCSLVSNCLLNDDFVTGLAENSTPLCAFSIRLVLEFCCGVLDGVLKYFRGCWPNRISNVGSFNYFQCGKDFYSWEEICYWSVIGCFLMIRV